ncbi:Npun_F0494 family protein [Microseira wollei]|uniref:Transcriptional regulator n=1 Tax=Microseira wollei NIES-4236 TaxID=2530354 RepID=A0AAV3X453_9CYAN|nr:Npun_F0494 family protein [Microseira wollei]GET35370.1 hypothetical protein MiSe_01120 [Microseira wollei NIES-4236]
MTVTKPQEAKSLTYPKKTIERASRALRCSPFQMPLFATMGRQSVDMGAIASTKGANLQYTLSPLSELAAENALMWLIQVGVLRREVDGQGITDSFRLTPLGHQIIEQWQAQGLVVPPPTWRDRIYNALSRWLRIF